MTLYNQHTFYVTRLIIHKSLKITKKPAILPAFTKSYKSSNPGDVAGRFLYPSFECTVFLIYLFV